MKRVSVARALSQVFHKSSGSLFYVDAREPLAEVPLDRSDMLQVLNPPADIESLKDG